MGDGDGGAVPEALQLQPHGCGISPGTEPHHAGSDASEVGGKWRGFRWERPLRAALSEVHAADEGRRAEWCRLKTWESAVFLVSYLVVLTVGYGNNHWSSHWVNRWFLFLNLFTILACYLIARRTHLLFLPLLLVLSIGSLWTSAWAGSYVQDFDVPMRLALSKWGLYSWAQVLAMGTILALLPARLAPVVRFCLGLTCVLASLYTLAQWQNIAFLRVAFSGNASMNGCLIAVTTPFFVGRSRFALGRLILPVVAIALTGASIPWLVLGVVLVSLRRWWWVLLAGLVGGLAFALNHPALGPLTSARTDVWPPLMEWWWAQGRVLQGMGGGVSVVMVPTIQSTLKIAPWAGGYMWLHNDWLQILFEYGLIGLWASGLAAAFLLYRGWKNPVLTASLLGFIAMGFVNYPLRLAPHAFALLLVCWLCLREPNEQR